MVKHIILWTLDKSLSADELVAVKQGIKEGLESLKGRIDGLVEIKVYTAPLPTANCDVMLESVFTSPEALGFYATHPEHVAVANEKVRPYTSSRVCMDCEF